MSYDNTYSQRAAKGQAYNLAVMTAIAEGKHKDVRFIAQEFYRHFQTAALLQKANAEQISQIIENPKLVELLKEVEEILNG